MANPSPIRRPSPEEAYAERQARRQRRDYLQALSLVLATPAGRHALAHILQATGVYRSIWTASAEIHYRAGRQDFGHELMLELLEAGEDSYYVMERENRDRVRRDAAEQAAFDDEQRKQEGSRS